MNSMFVAYEKPTSQTLSIYNIEAANLSPWLEFHRKDLCIKVRLVC